MQVFTKQSYRKAMDKDVSVDLAKVWESMRASAPLNIIEAVSAADLDVTQWSFNKNGSVSKGGPARNPAYNFQWAFSDLDGRYAACIWHNSPKVEGAVIAYEDNLRAHYLELDRIAMDHRRTASERSRARSQATSARKADSLLQTAYRAKAPVRVVILEPASAKSELLGRDRSIVKFRRVDPVSWYFHSYDLTSGHLRLVRGVRPPDAPLVSEGEPATIDQFEAKDVERANHQAGRFLRRAEVRSAVLVRTKGHCELCGKPGFLTAGGSRYLETHHVVPLAESGPDEIWNVVGICPDQHKRAHYGLEAPEIRRMLIGILAELYPGVAERLLNWSSSRPN